MYLWGNRISLLKWFKDLNKADCIVRKSSIKATLVEIIQVERTSTKEDTVPEIPLSFKNMLI